MCVCVMIAGPRFNHKQQRVQGSWMLVGKQRPIFSHALKLQMTKVGGTLHQRSQAYQSGFHHIKASPTKMGSTTCAQLHSPSLLLLLEYLTDGYWTLTLEFRTVCCHKCTVKLTKK